MGSGHEQEKLGVPAEPQASKPRNAVASWVQRHLPEGRDKVATLAILLSLWALYNTYNQNKAANAVSVASTFSSLRARYHDVDAKLPKDYMRDIRYRSGTEAARIVGRYWDNTFDEWFVATKLNDGGVVDLWKDYYAEAVGQSLGYPAMRAVYCDLEYAGRNRTKTRREFHAALLKEFAMIAPGMALCPVPEPNTLSKS
jgi:hypothetical protein